MMTPEQIAAYKAEEDRKNRARIAQSQAKTINLGQATPLSGPVPAGAPTMMQQMGKKLAGSFLNSMLPGIGTLFGFNKGGKIPCAHCGMQECNMGCKAGYSEGGEVQPKLPLAQQKQQSDERRKEEMHKLAMRHKEEQHQLALKMKARPPLSKGE